jgi:hypothetical protein
MVGEIMLYLYVPMFPWKDFLMGQIRNLKNTRRKGTDQENSKKQERKMEERKRRDFDV